MPWLIGYAAIGLVSAVGWVCAWNANERWSGGALAWSIVAGGLFWPIGALFLGFELWEEDFVLMFIFAILASCIVAFFVYEVRH